MCEKKGNCVFFFHNRIPAVRIAAVRIPAIRIPICK